MISYVSSYNLFTATYGTPEFLEMWSCISRFSCCFCFRLRTSVMNSCMCDNAFLVGVSMKLLICICELLSFYMDYATCCCDWYAVASLEPPLLLFAADA